MKPDTYNRVDVKNVKLNSVVLSEPFGAYGRSKLLIGDIINSVKYHPNDDPKSIFGSEYRSIMKQTRTNKNKIYGKRTTQRSNYVLKNNGFLPTSSPEILQSSK